MNTADNDWAIVIFSSRESDTVLAETIEAVLHSTESSTAIDVLINGNRSLVEKMSKRIALYRVRFANRRIRLWYLAIADKAHAWNQYIHHIWSTEKIVFFIDGYVQLEVSAIKLLGGAVSESSHALGGTGVPSVGRSAKKIRNIMLRQGGFHGNFCCIKDEALSRIKVQLIRLPVGLYRVDSLMGALLAFNVNPADNVWDAKRVLVHPDATWKHAVKHWWSWRDIRAKWRQWLRQARGSVENHAIKRLFTRMKIRADQLPKTVNDLVNEWVAADPGASRQFLMSHPISWISLGGILGQSYINDISAPPELID